MLKTRALLSTVAELAGDRWLSREMGAPSLMRKKGNHRVSESKVWMWKMGGVWVYQAHQGREMRRWKVNC